MPCSSQKPKWAAARTIQVPQKLEKNWKTYQNRTLPIKSSWEKNEGYKGEMMGNMKGWENRYSREPSWIPFRPISQGEKTILGVLEVPCTSQKPKWAAASWKNFQSPIDCPFLLIPIKSSLGGNEGSMGETGGSMINLETCRKGLVMKMMVEHHFAGIPKGRKFLFSFQAFKIYMKWPQNLVIQGILGC